MAVIENDVIKVTVSSSSTRNVIRVSPGVSALSSVSLSLNELNDVDTTGITNGQTIVYENGSFVAGDAGAVKTINGEEPDANGNVEVSINDLTDVKIVGAPAEGDALIFSNNFWTTGDAGASVLNDLTDVNIPTNPASGAILKYNGSQWTAQALSIPSVPATYYHQRYATDAQTFLTGATETVELYYTARADGDGLHESAQSDTPTAGYDIQRKLYYSEKAKADPDTSADWTQFTAIADNTSYNDAKTALLAYLNERTGGTSPISLKITWEEVVQAPSFTGLLNESYGSGAEAAYSTRRLNGNYSGDCMTIRRADGTTQSIGFVGEEIDESAIETFCSGTTCTVQVWRDQSGNGNDATAPSGKEPIIYTGGALVKEGGRLALDFATTDPSVLNLDTEVLSAKTIFSIASTHTLAAINYLLFSSTNAGGNIYYGGTSTGGGIGFYRSGYHDLGAPQVIGQQLGYFRLNPTNDNYDVASNGGTVTNLGNGYGVMRVESLARDYGDFQAGRFQEVIIYDADKSANRTDIEGNISAYFQSAKLLDEQFGEGAEAAYSTRQLRRDQTDCMVIRRASDSTTTTIGFDANGDIDETAIETFCTGTTCTVYQWLDQSGNGNDATAQSGDEPTIYTGGALVKENGKLALDFDGSNDKFQLGLSITNADSLSYFYTGNYIGSGAANQWMVQTSESPQLFVPVAEENDTNTSIIFGVSSTSYYASGTSVTLANRGDVYAAFAGKQTLSSIFGSSTVTLSNSYLGGRVGNSYMLNGLFQEFILYTTNKSSVRTSIESNIGDYFTQNTPLLDTYSGAAAAYSLRLLDSSYVGSAVEVYNGSSYADIGFNVFGELDTVALAAHCGSNTGRVSKWYDQSGNGLDLATSVDNDRGIIVNAGTINLNANGKVFINMTVSQYPIGSSIANPYTIACVWKASTDRRFLNGTGFDYNIQSDKMRLISGGVTLTGTTNVNNSIINLTTASTKNGNGVLRMNGSVDVTGLATTGSIPANSIVFNRLNITNWGPEEAYEFIIFDDEQGDISGIEDNINTFYSIY